MFACLGRNLQGIISLFITSYQTTSLFCVLLWYYLQQLSFFNLQMNHLPSQNLHEWHGWKQTKYLLQNYVCSISEAVQIALLEGTCKINHGRKGEAALEWCWHRFVSWSSAVLTLVDGASAKNTEKRRSGLSELFSWNDSYNDILCAGSWLHQFMF